jgi:hypothetical protein
MKKQLVTFGLAILMGVLGFAVSGVAVAGNGKPPSPPGQDQCEHGNNLKPCKDDPQPDKGNDCKEHGNQGGVNEDHCKGEDTTPTETTPTDTTPAETTPTGTTPTGTTPTETTPTDTTPTDGGNNPYTPPATVPGESSSTQAAEPSKSSEPTPEIQGKPPVTTTASGQPAVLRTTAPAVLGKTANAPKPTRQPQKAPFTL